MTTVFVSYRREETAGEARALFNELSTKLGKGSVFMDVDTIALGRDFRQILQEHLASCDLLLVIIGRAWHSAKDGVGRIRLEQPNDFVRLEIESALKRNIPVTPVLVQGAQMPTVDQLPPSIRDFAYRNGFELSHSRWESDVAEMCKRLGLDKSLPTASIRKAEPLKQQTSADERVTEEDVPPQRQRGKRWFVSSMLGIFAIAAASAGFLYYQTIIEGEASIEAARLEAARAKAEADNKIAALKEEAAAARANAEAKALADPKAAKDMADAAERERAAAAAARAQKDRAAARAEKDRAEKEQAAAAAAQAEKDRAAAALAQAEKDRAERARAAAQKAEAERTRIEAEEQRKRQALASQPSWPQKFTGSMTVSMGAYAQSAGLKQSDLTTKNTMGACAAWARELQLDTDEGRSFRASCMQLADFANLNGWQLGTKPTPQESMKFCSESAKQLSGDVRARFIRICLKYR